jgi:hypothetical protein
MIGEDHQQPQTKSDKDNLSENIINNLEPGWTKTVDHRRSSNLKPG